MLPYPFAFPSQHHPADPHTQQKHGGGRVPNAAFFCVVIKVLIFVTKCQWRWFFGSRKYEMCFLILLWLLHCIAQHACMLIRVQLFATPGSSVHGILQARILEWVAIFFSRGSSQANGGTHVSCTAGRFFTLSHLGRPT